MGTSVTKIPRTKVLMPTDSPLEAGDIACGACGNIMKRKVVMGPRSVEEVVYECRNEETGCKYHLKRKVPVTMYTQTGIPEEKK